MDHKKVFELVGILLCLYGIYMPKTDSISYGTSIIVAWTGILLMFDFIDICKMFLIIHTAVLIEEYFRIFK